MNHHFLSGDCTRCGEPRANLREHSHGSGGFENAATSVVKDRPNLATTGERLGAHLIDIAVLIALAVAVFSLVHGMALWALALPVGVLLSYRLLCDGLSGPSIGKRLIGNRAIHRESDSACGYLRSIVRDLRLPITFLTARQLQSNEAGARGKRSGSLALRRHPRSARDSGVLARPWR